jgi:hypothetical protein
MDLLGYEHSLRVRFSAICTNGTRRIHIPSRIVVAQAIDINQFTNNGNNGPRAKQFADTPIYWACPHPASGTCSRATLLLWCSTSDFHLG